jgi:hypothetical protein
MDIITGQTITPSRPMWECKQCSQRISDAETVAYHLVNRVLYGWCEACFSQRAEGTKSQVDMARFT